MSVQILLSCMNENGFDITKKLNIKTDAVIINQCDKNDYDEIKLDEKVFRMYSVTDRGLSKSRNLAIEKADDGLLVFADDDFVLYDNSEKIITSAFKEIPNAEAIAFTVKRNTDDKRRDDGKSYTKIQVSSKFSFPSSMGLVVKKSMLEKTGIRFNERFGAGSGCFNMAEDSLFCASLRKKGVSIYEHPSSIGEVNFDSSSWFSGYDEKYFHDVGAFLSAAFPVLKFGLMWYYPYRFFNLSDVSSINIIKNILSGFKSFKKIKNQK